MTEECGKMKEDIKDYPDPNVKIATAKNALGLLHGTPTNGAHSPPYPPSHPNPSDPPLALSGKYYDL
jgi:hypothetical protein